MNIIRPNNISQNTTLQISQGNRQEIREKSARIQQKKAEMNAEIDARKRAVMGKWQELQSKKETITGVNATVVDTAENRQKMWEELGRMVDNGNKLGEKVEHIHAKAVQRHSLVYAAPDKAHPMLIQHSSVFERLV